MAQPVGNITWRQEDPDTVFGFSAGFDDIDSDQFRRITRLLQLTREQRAAAMDLYSIYEQRSRGADRKVREYDQAVRKSLAVKDDPALRRQSEGTWKRHTAYRTRVRTTFFEDFRALLTPEQAARWPLVDRSLRRRPAFAGATRDFVILDLGRMVERAVHPGDPPPEVLEILERYDAEVDEIAVRAIAFRQSFWKQPGASHEAYITGFTEIAAPVLEINARAARKIAPLLPELAQSRFFDEFFLWTALGGNSLTLHGLDIDALEDAIKTLPDLTPEIREATADAQRAYRSALRQKQEEILSAVLADPSRVADARKQGARLPEWEEALKTLRLDYFRSLRGILTEQQLALLPAPLGKAEIAPPSFDD